MRNELTLESEIARHTLYAALDPVQGRGGDIMAIWNADMTSEDGALSAAQIGSYACFVTVVLSMIGLAVLAMASASSGATPIALVAMLSASAAELLVFLVAGLRLRAGKGVGWAIAAAAIMVLEIAMKLNSMTGVVGIVINVVVLICIINGVRGALALRRGHFDGYEATDIPA